MKANNWRIKNALALVLGRVGLDPEGPDANVWDFPHCQ
jgi:hypothetical protein